MRAAFAEYQVNGRWQIIVSAMRGARGAGPGEVHALRDSAREGGVSVVLRDDFEGANFCAYCGAETARVQKAKTDLPCPSCKNKNLGEVALGHTPVMECASCHGLWVDGATFDRICTDQEKQSAVLGGASMVFRPEGSLQPVRYLRCPECRELMHRVNFAKCSGIIVDICKGHGTWFDRDELQHIVQFIRTGGLEFQREKEKAQLESERRRVEAKRWEPVSYESPTMSRGWSFDETDLFDIAGSILRMLR